MERSERLRTGTLLAKKRHRSEEEQDFLPAFSTSYRYVDKQNSPLPGDFNPDLYDTEDAYFKRAMMASRKLGDLPSLRPLVNFHTSVCKTSKLPPAFAPSADEVNLFEARFGPGLYAKLDSMQVLSLICSASLAHCDGFRASSLSPDPTKWKNGIRLFEMFYGEWEGKELKLAGSKLLNFLLPCSDPEDGQPGVSLSVQLNMQSLILGDNREGYIITSQSQPKGVSAVRLADATYGLSLSALSKSTQIDLKGDVDLMQYPCLHPDKNCLLPFVSVELKVDGGLQKQTHQQALYGTWSIYQQLTLRVLAAGQDTRRLEGIKHYCLGIFNDICECWELTLVPDPYGKYASLRIRAQLLCKGSIHDEDWFTSVYCPWRAYIAKDAIFNQVVFTLPDIEHYATLPNPRPFDYDGPVLVAARDFVLGSFNIKSASFGHHQSQVAQKLLREVRAWRVQKGYMTLKQYQLLTRTDKDLPDDPPLDAASDDRADSTSDDPAPPTKARKKQKTPVAKTRKRRMADSP